MAKTDLPGVNHTLGNIFLVADASAKHCRAPDRSRHSNDVEKRATVVLFRPHSPVPWDERAMAISEIPIFSMLRTRLHWHQERQRVLAENVANAETPGFRPQDLVPPGFGSELARAGGVSLAQTDTAHFADSGRRDSFKLDHKHFAIRPAGNAVHLEDEMMKVAANQMDYQAASALYGRSLALIKLALGKSG